MFCEFLYLQNVFTKLQGKDEFLTHSFTITWSDVIVCLFSCKVSFFHRLFIFRKKELCDHCEASAERKIPLGQFHNLKTCAYCSRAFQMRCFFYVFLFVYLFLFLSSTKSMAQRTEHFILLANIV